MSLFSLLQPLREIPLAFLDVETTGASADFGHRVIELGIVRMEGGRIVAEYQQLFDPDRRISAGVSALTGITQSMVTGQPRFAEQLGDASALLQGAVLLGHNVRFDLSFLRKEFRRCRRDIVQALGDALVLDTVRIARRRFGRGGNGLQTLAPRLGIRPSVAHRALADAQTTAALFERLMEPLGGWDICLCDAIVQQGGPMGLLPVSPRESLLPLELEEALEQKCAVMMEYLDSRQHRTERMIEPLHVRRAGGELMLVAHCHLRNDRRTFKLERIVRLTRIEPQLKLFCLPPVFTTSPPDALASCEGLIASVAPVEGLQTDAPPSVETMSGPAPEPGVSMAVADAAFPPTPAGLEFAAMVMATRQLRGATLAYREQGQGLPIVFVHGFPLDGRMWDAQVAEFDGWFRVIVPDLRGFGQSRSEDPITMESLADDLHALLESIGALPCVLSGLSMGGYVTLAYARKYPADLRGLILVDTRAEADSTQGREARDKMIQLVRDSGATAVADQMMGRMLAPDAAVQRPQVVRSLRAIMEACPPKTIENAVVAMRDRTDQTESLPSIAAPTLILVGDGDAITPPSAAEAMHHRMPHSRLEIIQGAGHMSPMEQPAQVNLAIARFLDELQGQKLQSHQ